jgi:hypothetical protein
MSSARKVGTDKEKRVPSVRIGYLSFERWEIYGGEYNKVHWTKKNKQCEEAWKESIHGTSTVAKHKELRAMNNTC